MATTKRNLLMIGIVTAAALGSGVTYTAQLGKESTDDAVLETQVVTISPKINGYIIDLAVKDNQMVHKGDLLAQIDPTDYKLALDKAGAALQSAKARVAASSENYEATRISAPSNLDAATARVQAAEATWNNAAKTLKRMKTLSDLARSKQQLDDAISAESNALAALNDAKAQLATAQTAPQTIASASAAKDELSAAVQEAEADVKMAEENLANTKIWAPIDGKITSRGAELGNYVQTGQNLMSVVSPDVWVIANFKETQIAQMKPGQSVDIDVDAFPDLDLHGRVDSIQSGTGARFSAFPAQNATGNFVKIVQRVPVKIVLDQTDTSENPLGPGLSVVPTVHTK